jgi:putative PIN family toxin of toxin-antitoxin system
LIIFDVSALVGAAIRRDSVPERALRRALASDRIALSEPVIAELAHVLSRPRLARFMDEALRDEIEHLVISRGVRFVPTDTVSDCRDPKDNIYLELALAAGAHTIVSSDADLLVLHPWRGIRILTPADHLALPSAPPADSPA